MNARSQRLGRGDRGIGRHERECLEPASDELERLVGEVGGPRPRRLVEGVAPAPRGLSRAPPQRPAPAWAAAAERTPAAARASSAIRRASDTSASMSGRATTSSSSSDRSLASPSTTWSRRNADRRSRRSALLPCSSFHCLQFLRRLGELVGALLRVALGFADRRGVRLVGVAAELPTLLRPEPPLALEAALGLAPLLAPEDLDEQVEQRRQGLAFLALEFDRDERRALLGLHDDVAREVAREVRRVVVARRRRRVEPVATERIPSRELLRRDPDHRLELDDVLDRGAERLARGLGRLVEVDRPREPVPHRVPPPVRAVRRREKTLDVRAAREERPLRRVVELALVIRLAEGLRGRRAAERLRLLDVHQRRDGVDVGRPLPLPPARGRAEHREEQHEPLALPDRADVRPHRVAGIGRAVEVDGRGAGRRSRGVSR